MAHFKVLVILPANTNNVEEKVRNLLNSYYSELEVEPYKEYLDQAAVEKEVKRLSTLPKESLEKLAADLDVSSDNLEEIAKLNLDWDEDELVEADEHGFYRMTTINPQGKWDWYSFIEAELRESATPIRYPCRVVELPEVIPYAIVTPDGRWYEAGGEVSVQAFMRIYLNSDVNTSAEEVNWNLKVQKTLACYPDCFVVALNCHI
jgi:hypothetical protein